MEEAGRSLFDMRRNRSSLEVCSNEVAHTVSPRLPCSKNTDYYWWSIVLLERLLVSAKELLAFY
jgi:hypothetical protein